MDTRVVETWPFALQTWRLRRVGILTATPGQATIFLSICATANYVPLLNIRQTVLTDWSEYRELNNVTVIYLKTLDDLVSGIKAT